MKTIALLLFAVCLLPGCVSSPSGDFVQGWIRITPPVQFDSSYAIPAADGGTLRVSFVDAKGRKRDYYIDHRLGTKTPGATRMALLSAMVPIPDYKELERIIYNYKVAHLKSQ